MPPVLFLALFLQTEPAPAFSPDRPGFSDSTGTVPPGRVQVELGATGAFEDEASFLTLPSIFLRVGLTDFLEARVTAPDLQLTLPKEGGERRLGAADMSVGLKLGLSFGELFSASAVPFLTVPTGSRDVSSGDVTGGAGFNFQLTPIADLALGWNVILASGFSLGAGVSVGYQFTEAFGAFVEAYLQWMEGDSVQPSAGGGLTYLITPTLQIDIAAGGGLTPEAEGPYVLGGFALLL